MKVSAISNTKQTNLKPNFKGRLNLIELNAHRVEQFKEIGQNTEKLTDLIKIIESTYKEAERYIKNGGFSVWFKDLEHMGKFVKNCKEKPSRAAAFFINKFSNKKTPFYHTFGVNKDSSELDKYFDLIFTVEAELKRNFNNIPVRPTY